MKALLFVEPLLLHSRPYHYWAILGSFARMAHALRSVGWEVRFVCNEAIAERAVAPLGEGTHVSKLGHGMPPEEIVILGQEIIRRCFDRLPNARIFEALHRPRADEKAGTEAYARLLRESLGDFVPDAMVSVTPGAQLRAAFPDAVLLSSAPAAYSRWPYGYTCFLDPVGLWDRSIPALHAEELLAREPTPDERELLAAFRRRFGAYFATISPFGPLFADLRSRHRAVGLLPLQFAGEPGFDCNAPFRSQGEYLFHVLETLPPDVALVVVEHPTARWLGDYIDEETRELIGWRYPNVTFLDSHVAESAGQALVVEADFVIAVSSSIGLQALFYEKPLVAVGWSHLLPLATLAGMDDFPAEGPLPAHAPRLDRVLCWFLSHYFIASTLFHDAAWLSAFLERSIARHREGRLGLDFFEAIGPPDVLATELFALLDRLSSAPMTARLQNGNFADWSGALPTGWDVLDFTGSQARATRSVGPTGAAARIERQQTGEGASLFLQRIPDAASVAGAMVRLRFSARSDVETSVLVYIYLQVRDGKPSMGTQGQPFAFGPAWRGYQHVGSVPGLEKRTPGPGSHVEVVFLLPPEAGSVAFEVADVVLEPVIF